MKVKFCYQCGAPLEGDGKVCTSCGTKIEENDVVAEKKPAAKQEKKKWDSRKHTAPAVLWTLLLVLFAWLAAALYSFSTVVEEDNLLNFAQNVEWMDIEMETITEGKNRYDTLGEIAFSYVKYYTGGEYGYSYRYAVTEEAFEELAEEDFFQEYVVNLVLRYVDAIKEKNYKKGALTLKDVSDFLDKNERKIDKIFDDGYVEYCNRFLEWYAEQYEDEIADTEELLSLKTYQKKWKTVFNLLAFVLNNYLCYIFLGLAGIFVIIILVLKRGRSLGYVGSASLLAGGLLLATRIYLLDMVEKLEAPFHLGVEVLPVLLNSFSKMSLLLVIALFAVALLGIIIRVKIKNKTEDK